MKDLETFNINVVKPVQLRLEQMLVWMGGATE